MSRKEYQDQKKKILEDSIYGRERKVSEGEVQEVEEGNKIEQSVFNALGQDGGQNLIYEKVSNILSDGFSYTNSYLLIQNIKDGTTLDLNALLPSDYKYVPGAMFRVPLQFKNQTIDQIDDKQSRAADLKSYKMGTSGAATFIASPSFNIVSYGELRKAGGILTLLHEVAHTWQFKYYNVANQGRAGFEKNYDEIVSEIAKLDKLEYGEQHEDREKIWEELRVKGVECLDKNGVRIPIEEEGVINIPNIHSQLVSLVNKLGISDAEISEHFRQDLASSYNKSKLLARFYPIKSAKLEEAMDSYIAGERDAWAHAIRTLRFLRQKGFDIEPQLQKIDDFKEIIDPCLSSYQQSLNTKFLKQKNAYRFNRETE